MVELGWPNWIGVVVDDLAAQRSWYGSVLGLREQEAEAGWAQFDFGDGRVLELIERSTRPEYNARRFQVGFVVDDLGAAARELARRGVEAISGILGGDEDGGAWCYFRDPEGNVFELKQATAAARVIRDT